MRHLADPTVARLEGHWTLELSLNRGGVSGTVARQGEGTVALVLNRERNTTSAFGSPPELFGSYDFPFDSLGRGVAPSPGPPDAWAIVTADSVFVRLSPQSDISVVLAGVWRGDSIAGRWFTSDRAGPNALGDFVLRSRH